jgi:T5orf172 domain.
MRLVMAEAVGYRTDRKIEKLIHLHLANARIRMDGRQGETEWFAIKSEHADQVGRITERFIDVIGAHNHDVDVDNYIDAEIERVHNVNARIRNG